MALQAKATAWAQVQQFVCCFATQARSGPNAAAKGGRLLHAVACTWPDPPSPPTHMPLTTDLPPPNARHTHAHTAAFREGKAAPVLIGFEVTRQQAVGLFNAQQRERCKGLQAADVLASAAITPQLLPFWLFDAVTSAECKGTLGRRADK